ncbi:PAS domain-containing sensor histidine kinase [Halobacteria archaeon AArc-m2/3/4]|uniref:histidine kinase n=1 Tax=Natronoglomus mannanivorans TaxID=2979990 RepID=A0AAP2YXN2_9EURY|nr:PAS domain-containing sensor histidine kinase [Halobacteria archaeon AArc-xg1-1]MCU4972655.1 PAS domain-containing sensor histidine kinase [Halobacteria archaeon AArc-m2/3/4]
MKHRELVAKFSQTVGVEKAESLITDALDALEIDRAESYTHHELADICETIQQTNGGYVGLVANEIRVYEQAQRRFDALLDEITDPIVTVTFEDSIPVVAAMNPAFETAFDCDASAIGQPLPTVVDVDDGRGDVIDRWFRSDHSDGTEIQSRIDGERRTFLFRSVVVSRENGDVEGYGIYTDITERKHRERRLEHQNEQLERFASVVSHDLRNPLTIAEGNLELAMDLVENETAREQLRKVGDAHQRMSQLIEDLLALARQGQTVDSPEVVALSDVVSEAWSTVSTETVELEAGRGIDVALEADRPRLRQLLENLFRNCVEHGQTGNTRGESGSGPADRSAVTVRVGVLEDDRDGFYIADDGPGIAPDDRETVFEHGYTTRSEGTGFGLAIVRAVADAHEWSVGVTDSWDGGARFEIDGVTFVEK